MVDPTASNGWTAVPLDAAKIFPDGRFKEPGPLILDEIDLDSDPAVGSARRYAKEQLDEQTFNHSMRVFYFGMAIVGQQFPEHAASFAPSTLALAALLHDIGATETNRTATRMSFEFYGAFKALNLVQSFTEDKDQAEAVCEAIIRHQDLGTDGNITFLGQILQLATVYDNVGSYPNIPDFAGIIHEKTREDVIRKFPRTGWLGCFSGVVRDEQRLKPWCHTTHIPNFGDKIMANELMLPYE